MSSCPPDMPEPANGPASPMMLSRPPDMLLYTLRSRLALLDATVLVTGESGIFLSPYYMDQWPAWYGGLTFVFPFTKAAVEQHRAHEITLTPK